MTIEIEIKWTYNLLNLNVYIFAINRLNIFFGYVVGLYLKMMKIWYICDMVKSFWNWKKIYKWERDVQKWKKPNSFAMSATFQNINDDCKYVSLSIQ
jgi:hypothetical protein